VKRFDPRLGAGVLIAGAALCAAVSLATGHSARQEVPPDLSARPADAALDVWKAAALMVNEDTFVADLRPSDAHARYHLPGSLSMPGASASDVRAAAGARSVLVYAGKDEVARRLLAELRKGGSARAWYLADGARAWYLSLALPVPLFSESGPPDGYPEALRTVTAWFERPDEAARSRVEAALQELARANYQPTLLKAGKKASAAPGGTKKISGGCG
jgi:rhodanese-related sulfurtransferase